MTAMNVRAPHTYLSPAKYSLGEVQSTQFHQLETVLKISPWTSSSLK